MKTRYVVCQTYLYILSFALLSAGGVALIGHMSNAMPARGVAPGSALALALLGLILLAILREWRRLRLPIAALLFAMALLNLTPAPWIGDIGIIQPVADFIRVRDVLAILILLILTTLGNRTPSMARAIGAVSGSTVIAAGCASQFAYGWPLIANLRLGSSFEASIVLNMFAVMLGVAAWLLPLLPRHEKAPDRTSLAVGLIGVLVACLGWQLLSQHAFYSNDTPALPFATLLPTLAMLFGLCFSFFLMLSQQLARLAIVRARHLRQANQELTASLRQRTSLETLNQRIMHFSLDVLCSVDEQGRFTQISPSCEAVFGYRPAEMLGRPFIDFVLPEDRERTRQVVAEDMCIGGQGRPHFQNRYRHKDGRIVHVMWSAVWSVEERAMFAIAHDITRLVLSEAFTQGQRDILEMVSTNQPLPAILNAICVMAEAHSPNALCSILLRDSERKHLLRGAAPSLPSSYNQAIHEVPIGPKKGTCGAAAFYRKLVVTEDIATDPLWSEYRELTLGHGLRACCSSPMLAHDGEVLGTFAIYQREAKAPDNEQSRLIDICGQLAAIAVERDRDRRSLQESEQRYRSLFAFNPNPVFSFGLAGDILSINQAGCDLSGYTQEELIGQNFSGHVLQEDLPRVMAHFQAVLSGEPQRYEVKVHDRQGAVQEMDIASLPIVVGDRIVGVFGIGKDITERKAAERTLHATLKELERSNRELQDFAFVASHDLQEPLRKIRAFSERLEMKATSLDDDARDYLHRMSSAAERMQALIRDLLAFSRLSTHVQVFEELDLNRILADVLRDMEASLEASQAHIESESLPRLPGDATQMRQLLQNLVSNAIKFHREGQPPRVRIHAEQPTQGEWTLCVTDQGIGFDEKYLDRIFNPFQRLHGRQAYAGTGIGLAIVKKIAERHNARITASSHPGQGATFRITFNIPSEDQAHAE